MTNPTSSDTGGIDAAHYRNVLGHFPTGVTVITGMHDGAPVGMAIGSFSSVSLDPPLVLFCPQKSSSSWPLIEASGGFCANILSSEQEDVCRVMAVVTTTPDEHRDWQWLPWTEAAERCFSWTNRDAILLLKKIPFSGT